MLVEPDRDVRLQPQDQPVRYPGLGLREWVRARLVDAAHPAPADREVAVEVDAVRVGARVRRAAVRVEDGDDPEVDPARGHPGEALRDGDPRGLVAVDAAD